MTGTQIDKGTMLAMEISKPGGPEVLRPVERPMPVPGEDEVLIKVQVAGVNRPDCLQRRGVYPAPVGASDLPGLEVSGQIVACGSNVRRFSDGDEVMALVAGGGYAQYVCVNAGCVMDKPLQLSFQQAGGLPETFLTVWHNVFQRGKLKEGETFLVHGGSSGIGSTAIQIAKKMGANVMATAGSREKCDWCEALGADLAINYHEEDFVEAVKNHTDGDGADVILDMVGGSYIQRNIECAAIAGRIVQIAFLESAKAEVNFAPIMTKRIVFTGSTLRPRLQAFKKFLVEELTSQVMPFVVSGEIVPKVTHEFDLEDAAKAHTLMEAGGLMGKIVLKVPQ